MPYGGGLFGGFRERQQEKRLDISRDMADALRYMRILGQADERSLLAGRKKKAQQELTLGETKQKVADLELKYAPERFEMERDVADARIENMKELRRLQEKGINARIAASDKTGKMQVIPAGGVGVIDGEIVARAPRRGGSKTFKTMNPATRIKLKTQRANLEMGMDLVSRMNDLVSAETVGPEGAINRGADWLQAAFEGKNIVGYEIPPDADRRATELQDLVDRFTQENWKELVGPGGLTASDIARLEKATKTGIKGSAASARNAFRGILETFQKRKQVIDDEMRLGTVTTVEGDLGNLSPQNIMDMSDEEFDALEALYESGGM